MLWNYNFNVGKHRLIDKNKIHKRPKSHRHSDPGSKL